VHAFKIITFARVVTVESPFTDDVKRHIGIGEQSAARGINREIKRGADGGNNRYRVNGRVHPFVWFDCD
jgi:hypothetical protein